MPLDSEADKLTLVELLASRAAAPDAAPRVDPGFLRAFYRNVAAEDVLGRPPEHLLAAAASLWSFMAERRPGRARLRMASPGGAGPDWAEGRAVVEIVNDDMPFLVDSVTAALNRLDLVVHLTIHPVVPVERDGAGRLVGLGQGGAGDIKESAMQIELAGSVDAERQSAALAALETVLADVRVTVIDWAGMRKKAEQLADEIAAGALPVPAAEAAEAAAFLTWLTDNNFTFLGYREYGFGGTGLEVVPGVGKGFLRNDEFLVFEGLRNFSLAPPEVEQFLRSPQLMMISKSNRRSTVHRATQMDTIVVKHFDGEGSVVGFRLLLGLFTSTSYSRSARSIPVIRVKLQRCVERARFAPDSHDGKALQHILDTYPRDELFQTDEPDLFATALGILHLQERQRVALFVRRDPFGRFASCLVFVPRDRYAPEVGRRMGEILAESFNGTLAATAAQLDESEVLARLHFIVDTAGGAAAVDLPAVEQRLVEASRVWADRLGEALVGALGEAQGGALLRRFAEALPTAYVERFPPAVAVGDIQRAVAVERGAPIALTLYREAGAADGELRLKTFHAGGPAALSDVLPMLENLGLRVLNEIPFEVRARGAASSVWIQEFQLALRGGGAIDLAEAGPRFEGAFAEIWSGTLENDGFNRLVLQAGLAAREVVILRCYSKLLRQAGSSFSQAYMEDTASAHPAIARQLVRLFERQFDPAQAGEREADAAALGFGIETALDAVENLDEDRILRSFLLLIRRTLRTNFYQPGADGAAKPYLAIKLASREIELLPLPRPLVEIYVYSARMEGCHLRGGKVARGGIRWSDRKEDFRTEVLGLMKAQMVKNAVIVPLGSKGGFVVKRPPGGGREGLMAEVVFCYQTLMRGLLDLTDTIRGDAVLPPPAVIRRDADDPYLVVAADKGTATFSDIANGIAIDYGFWLGDAFASGGSVGYDHKAMGITARGAWEAVKRHFRELGTDIQATGFSCVGVGDMSGDVFGNGMLLSRRTRLIAAFDHRHVFIDPAPDPAPGWAERKRLFALPRSSWADYDRALLSPGGGIYERGAKSIALSPEARQVLGIAEEALSPARLIQALLRQPVDLLWFGGIGTYVKASLESQADAGDRANDGLRVDAAELRAKVIGEGANLAMTQRARIEYALKGGRLNTDAIDNSAGVDTSDHEVNIKIAIGNMLESGKLEPAGRAALLAAMTGEVAELVLADNYLQSQALSLAEAEAGALLDQHVRLMRALERAGRLDRAIEYLPDEETLAQRAAAKRGLTRPELAVLLAYAKNALYAELLDSDLPDAPELEAELLAYFPQQMRKLAPEALRAHRLRREIVATRLANAILNRMGPSFVVELAGRTGRSAAEILRAFHITAEIFRFAEIWRAVEGLDASLRAGAQARLLIEVKIVAERATRWLLLSGLTLDIAARIKEFAPGVRKLAARLPGLLPEGERHGFERRKAGFLEDGVPAPLAERVVALTHLAAGLDIVRIDETADLDVLDMGRLYYEVGETLGLDALREVARSMPATTTWQRLAAAAVLDDLYLLQGEIAQRALAERSGTAAARLDRWVAQRREAVARLREMVAEIVQAKPPDLAMLTVATRRLRALGG